MNNKVSIVLLLIGMIIFAFLGCMKKSMVVRIAYTAAALFDAFVAGLYAGMHSDED